MKILGSINKGFTHINSFKLAKMSDDVTASGLNRYKNSDFYYERGTLTESDIQMANELKTLISETLSLISSPIRKIKQRLTTCETILEAPKSILAVKVDNPRVTAISGRVKTVVNEEYLDLTVHGYLGDKKRFIINSEGEIVKYPSSDFFTTNSKTNHTHSEPIYYSHHEIKNLSVTRDMKLFKNEICKLLDYLSSDNSEKKEIQSIKENDWASFISNQKAALDSIRLKFDKLYNGILNNTSSSIQRNKLSDICGLKLYKKLPVMQIDNINDAKNSAIINFLEMSHKQGARIVVYGSGSKANRLFIDSRLVQEFTKSDSNPFTVGRIIKFYSPLETQEFGIPKLLEDIDERLSFALKQLRAVIGSSRIDN